MPDLALSLATAHTTGYLSNAKELPLHLKVSIFVQQSENCHNAQVSELLYNLGTFSNTELDKKIPYVHVESEGKEKYSLQRKEFPTTNNRSLHGKYNVQQWCRYLNDFILINLSHLRELKPQFMVAKLILEAE